MTSPTTGQPRRALVTGATGYVGSQVAAALLGDGWAVRALSRSRAKAETKDYAAAIVAEGQTAGAGQVEIVEGDASGREDLARALADVDVAWYLLHSMGGGEGGDFVAAERAMAQTFAEEAQKAGWGASSTSAGCTRAGRSCPITCARAWRSARFS